MAAMSLLARREHSVLELRQKLSARDFKDDEINLALDLLIEQNHQSDERFAGEFVRMRFRQGKGSRLITEQLKQKGIDEFDFANFDFYALALRVRVQKYGGQPPKNHHERAKQQRFLQSRGFDFAQINQSFERE